MSKRLKIYLLAGEPSGDKLGAALMTGLKTFNPDIEFRGVAGPLMQNQGMESLFPMDELSVMGIAEVLPRYTELRRRLHETAEDCIAWKPDALLTIDSPDFSLRLAKLVKATSDIRTIHYVAPSVWAWRAGRAAKMARSVDHVLALLPFEPPFMENEGMRCDFVGHPVATETIASDAEAKAFRRTEGIGHAPLIMVLPGSRRNEVTRLAGLFGDSLHRVLAETPGARVVVPTVSPVADTVKSATRHWPGNPIILDPRPDTNASNRKRAAFRAADVALAASGTVSLELAANGTPMVIAYDMNWLSWQIISRMVKVDTVTLVNLVAEQKVVPEFLGPACEASGIASALGDLLINEQARAAQLKAMSEVMVALGKGGETPGVRAARAVLEGIYEDKQLTD